MCVCAYIRLHRRKKTKNMFWMNIHLPAIFGLAQQQVLRLHKHLTWTAKVQLTRGYLIARLILGTG